MQGRKLRSAVGVFAATSCAAVLMAACGGTSNASGSSGAKAGTQSTGAVSPPAHSYKGQTLTVFDGAPSGATAKETQAYYNALGALFKKETGANLKWSYYASPDQEVSTVETSTVSGSGPDVISYGTSFVGTLMATGDFPLLTKANWNTLGGKSSFIKADLFDSGTSSSKDIGIPYETNPFVLAYNTKDFQKAGITTMPKTWRQLVSDAGQIQKKVPGVTGVGIDPQDNYDPWKSVYFIDYQMGPNGNWVAANGKSTNLDAPQVQKALEFYLDLYAKYHVVSKAEMTWNSADMTSAFTSGKVAMELISSYDPTLAQGTALQGHLGYALLPTVPYGKSSLPKGGIPIETETTGNYWAIPGYAKSERSLALEFEKLSLSPQIQLKQFQLMGWMPVNQAGVKAVENANKSVTTFIKAESDAFPTSVAPVWSYVETGMLTAIHNIASNVATTGKLNLSYLKGQLSNAQQAAQAHA